MRASFLMQPNYDPVPWHAPDVGGGGVGNPGGGGYGQHFNSGLAALGYTGPGLGSQELRDARAQGEHPIAAFLRQYRMDNPGSHPWMQAFGQNTGVVPPSFNPSGYQPPQMQGLQGLGFDAMRRRNPFGLK